MNPVRLAIAVGLVAAAALALALVLVTRGGHPVAAPRDALVASTRLSTTSALFGDRLRAQITVVADNRRVDPASIRFRTEFAPYALAAAPLVTRERVGRVTHVVYTAPLVCFTQSCVPPLGSGTRFEFAPARVSFARFGGATRTLTLVWRPLLVGARTSTEDFANVDAFRLPPSRANVEPAPPTYSVSPRVLRPSLFAASGLLALAALVLLARFVAAGRIFRRSPLTPLERAVALVESTGTRGDARERRKALARLSEELARAGASDLSSTARELAWAETARVPVSTLTVDVRRLIAERSNGHAR